MTDPGLAVPPGTLTAAWLVARKDLAIEFRTRTAFLSALVFALLGVTIFYFAWDSTAVTASDLAPGVLWVIFTFAGLLGLGGEHRRERGNELVGNVRDQVAEHRGHQGALLIGQPTALVEEEIRGSNGQPIVPRARARGLDLAVAKLSATTK